MALGKPQFIYPNISQPFRWSPDSFSYLGMTISPCLKDLYRHNFTPLLHTIKHNLDRWCGLPLSLLGRIHLIKMNILPRLLYLFQTLTILLSKKTLAQLNSSITSFIWCKQKPRLIRYDTVFSVCLPSVAACRLHHFHCTSWPHSLNTSWNGFYRTLTLSCSVLNRPLWMESPCTTCYIFPLKKYCYW